MGLACPRGRAYPALLGHGVGEGGRENGGARGRRGLDLRQQPHRDRHGFGAVGPSSTGGRGIDGPQGIHPKVTGFRDGDQQQGQKGQEPRDGLPGDAANAAHS